jgi:GAF domain-containing protein
VIVNSEASLDLGDRACGNVQLGRALGIPLIARDSFVGTMTLYSGAPFTEDQSRVAQVIAPHLAQAIWTSRRAEEAAHTASTSPGRNQASSSHMRLISTR